MVLALQALSVRPREALRHRCCRRLSLHYRLRLGEGNPHCRRRGSTASGQVSRDFAQHATAQGPHLAVLIGLPLLKALANRDEDP